MNRLEYDTRLQKSIERLRMMGLKFHIETPSQNEVLLLITLESLVHLIESKITYPTKESAILEKWMVIHFWKGDKPLYPLKDLGMKNIEPR